MPPHSLKYYENETKFNGVFLGDNFPKKIKNGAYVINFDKYADARTRWIALFCNRSQIGYFNSFGVEHVPEEIKEFIENKNIKAKIFRVHKNNFDIVMVLIKMTI